MARYTLEFYAPGETSQESIYAIESDVPFLPMQRGDLINPTAWPPRAAVQVPRGALLKVIGIEHYIEVREKVAHFEHKLGIFMTAVRDTAKARRFK
jgi:hypothetical protein